MNRLPAVFLLCAILLLPARSQPHDLAEGVTTYRVLFDASTRAGVGCYRIPALATAANGDLLAAVDERVPSCADLRDNRDINIVLRRSRDGGATWSAVETVVDFPAGRSASDPSMIVDDTTGTVFLFYNVMDHDEAPGRYRLHVVRSTDHGATWSAPADITAQITKPAWADDFMFITSGRGIRTRDGTLLHTLVNLDAGLHLFGSDDRGASWFLIDTPIRPGNESKVVELAGGAWMVNSRVNDAGLRHVHVSTDRGRTWRSRPDSALVDPGVNASLIRYTSTADGFVRNRLLFANAASAEARENLTLRLSTDEGTTWTAGKTLYPGPAAYVSLTVLDGGDVGVLFEKDDYTETVFARVSLDWLTDGADRLAKTP